MQTLIQDLRYALRGMRRAPGFAITAVLTLALGIGATTAVFTLVYQVILRSLPVAHPEQLYKIGKGDDCCVEGGLQVPWTLFSYDLYKALREETPGTEGIAAVSAKEFTMGARRSGANADTQPLAVEFVSGNYFPLLGVVSYAGRMLQPADDRAGAAPAAVLSYPLWQRKFAADPHLVGSTILLSSRPVTVVGIAAPNFLGERNEMDPAGVWLPIALEPEFNPDEKLVTLPAIHWLDLLTRIPDSSRVPQVQLAAQAELRRWVSVHPQTWAGASPEQVHSVSVEITSARGGINSLRRRYEKNLRLLLLVAGFVLLIACANLANLMLVRGVARQSELALRSALGAPRLRLIRQTLVEAVLIALAGGVVALGVAYGGTRAMLALAFKGVEISPISATPSLSVLVFALGIAVLTGLSFGTAPAWIASRFQPIEALQGANRSTGDSSATPQRVLVISQAALSLALLSVAGLLITSLRHLEHQDFRFEPGGRLIVFTDLTAAGYTADRLPTLYRQIDDALARLPALQHVGYGTYAPMTGSNWSTSIWFPGQGEKPQLAGYMAASADYFAAVGTHVLLGRGFSPDDTPTSGHVAVVNQAFVAKFLAGKQPIGLHFGPDPGLRNEFEIVGVVENTKYGDPKVPAEPMFFKAITQTTPFSQTQDIAVEDATHFASNLVIQYRGGSSVAAEEVRTALKSINPDIPILQMITYQEQLGDKFTQEELVVRLTTLFGLIALLLASIGLYGVTAYGVTRRTGEIGVRMALGASRLGVLAMIVRGALGQVAVGLALGVPLSLLAGRLLQHSLYQTGGFQPAVLLGVVLLLLAAASAAALIPARRAAAVEPMQALRTQ